MIFNGNPECLCVLYFLLPTVKLSRRSTGYIFGLQVSSPSEIPTVIQVDAE